MTTERTFGKFGQTAGFEYVRITWESLAPHARLIRNWRRASTDLAACRELVLTPQCNEVLDLFKPE
ncbi:MAG TPA: hypothetical protein VNO35_00960, partial [Steroidobacteraceae bacterium]|nr:hypothetical protein [Steroidobacteraceae bacterium]